MLSDAHSAGARHAPVALVRVFPGSPCLLLLAGCTGTLQAPQRHGAIPTTARCRCHAHAAHDHQAQCTPRGSVGCPACCLGTMLNSSCSAVPHPAEQRSAGVSSNTLITRETVQQLEVPVLPPAKLSRTANWCLLGDPMLHVPKVARDMARRPSWTMGSPSRRSAASTSCSGMCRQTAGVQTHSHHPHRCCFRQGDARRWALPRASAPMPCVSKPA